MSELVEDLEAWHSRPLKPVCASQSYTPPKTELLAR